MDMGCQRTACTEDVMNEHENAVGDEQLSTKHTTQTIHHIINIFFSLPSCVTLVMFVLSLGDGRDDHEHSDEVGTRPSPKVSIN
jgi:hypothetical protein